MKIIQDNDNYIVIQLESNDEAIALTNASNNKEEFSINYVYCIVKSLYIKTFGDANASANTNKNKIKQKQ